VRSARVSRAREESAALREGLDAPSGADERGHHQHAECKQRGLKDVRALLAESGQDCECPAAGKRRAEHLGADQDGGADDGDDIRPDDLTGGRRRRVHVLWGPCLRGPQSPRKGAR